MARFAASPPDYIGNSLNARRQYQGRFDPQRLVSGAYTFGGEAANAVSLPSVFGSMNSPDYEELAVQAASQDAAEKMAMWKAEGDMFLTGLQGKRLIERTEERADAIRSEADSKVKQAGFNAIKNVALAALPFIAASDEDIKHTIDEIDDALETLRKLRPVTFYYKEEYTENPHLMHHGFIAQEYQKVLPDATYVDSFTGKLCIDTGDLIGLLVRANQQLESRITRLEVKQALATV